MHKQKKQIDKLLKKQKAELALRKSREVILGQTAEKLAPFLESFEFNPQKCQFLGQPIDYVVFDDDEVVFIEIKSGKAKLSAKQKNIKKLIEEKKIRWKEIRI